MPNVLNEYLVRLGFDSDKLQYAQFVGALKDVESQVNNRYLNMAKKAAEFQFATLGAFAAIGAGTLGFMDSVAQADQNYRLFALHMYTSLPVARELKVALDALGQPLENVMFDPELAERFHQLVRDQQIMAAQLGPNFENNMRSIRDARFEVTRFGVELKYLGMNVVNDLFKAFGKGGDDLMANLRHFNAWFIANIPFFSYWITSKLKPMLLDIRDVFKTIWDEIKNVDLDKVAKDVEGLVKLLAHASEVMVHLVGGAIDLGQGKYKDALNELKAAGAALVITPPAAPESTKSYAEPSTLRGGLMEGMVPPLMGAGAALATQANIKAAIIADAKMLGVTPELALAVAQQESSLREFGPTGKVLTSNKGALGVMQLMPKTAEMLGVNPNDVGENIFGGILYLRQLLDRSDIRSSLNTYSGGAKGYADSVLGKQAVIHKGDINITIHAGPNAKPTDIAVEIQRVLRQEEREFATKQNYQTQRNINEFSVPSWSYGQ